MAVSGTDLLWGCPQMYFKANPPFNEMTQGFATFKKEALMAQYFPGLFENLRKYFCNVRVYLEGCIHLRKEDREFEPFSALTVLPK